MESDSDSYFEESSSEDEQGMVGPLHVKVEVSIEEAPESPPPQPGSPLILPQPVLVGELAPVWELPDDGTNFLNYFTRVDVLELKNWAVETGARMNEENYVVEWWSRLLSLKVIGHSCSLSMGSSGRQNSCSLQLGHYLTKCWHILPVMPV